MYGYKAVRNINDLTVNGDGFVVNSLGSPNADLKGTLTTSDFEINEHGYVIVKGTKGTEQEQVIFHSDVNGDDERQEIGNTNPDWNLGLSSNFSWKNFNFYFVLDHQHGGEIYNSTKQRVYRAERHADQEAFAKQGKHITYSNNASNMDRGLAYTSPFIEDGTFTKLREVSLGYTLKGDKLGKANKIIKELKLSVIGRNLFTWTNYTGFDPEAAYIPVTSETRTPNPTNDRRDNRSYPQFRTFTGMIQLTF